MRVYCFSLLCCVSRAPSKLAHEKIAFLKNQFLSTWILLLRFYCGWQKVWSGKCNFFAMQSSLADSCSARRHLPTSSTRALFCVCVCGCCGAHFRNKWRAPESQRHRRRIKTKEPAKKLRAAFSFAAAEPTRERAGAHCETCRQF